MRTAKKSGPPGGEKRPEVDTRDRRRSRVHRDDNRATLRAEDNPLPVSSDFSRASSTRHLSFTFAPHSVATIPAMFMPRSPLPSLLPANAQSRAKQAA
jgi:hypothetical protein